MTWRQHDTWTSSACEVHLDDFTPPQLLQSLIDRQWLSEAEAALIQARAKARDRFEPIFERQTLVDADTLGLALAELVSGRREEALIHLERALGSEWIGRLV